MKTQFSLALGVISLAVGTLSAQNNYHPNSNYANMGGMRSNQDNSNYSNMGGMRSNQVHQGYRDIHTQELRNMLRSNPSITVVDARTKDYENDARIPRAKFISPDAQDEVIMAALPDRNAMIVVYCADSECVASQFLAKRLNKMGYSNVSRYAEGIEGWKNSGNPTENPSSERNAKTVHSKY